MKSKIKKFLSKTIMPFFGKNDAIKPVRVFTTIFLSIIIASLIVKLQGITYISDMLVLGLMGQVSILLAADTWRSNNKDKYRQFPIDNVRFNKENKKDIEGGV